MLGVMCVLSSTLIRSLCLCPTSDQTGRTDIPLTQRGVEQIKSKAPFLVGDGSWSKWIAPCSPLIMSFSELIDTVNLQIVLVSPRRRAHDTFHHLTGHLPQPPNHVFTESVREWDYGDYEGLKPHEIRAKQPTWSIWKDGSVLMPLNKLIYHTDATRHSCPNGESVEEMTARVDHVIADVRYLASPIRCQSLLLISVT